MKHWEVVAGYTGFAAGTFITAFSLASLKLSPVTIVSDWATLTAAIAGGVFGAVAGGVVTGFVTAHFNQKAQFDMKKASAQETLIKLNLIRSELKYLRSYIDEGLSQRTEHDGLDAPVWVTVSDLPGNFDPITIEPKDLIAFISDDEPSSNLLDGIVNAAIMHRTTCEAINHYSQLRREIQDLLPVEEVNGLRVRSNVNLTEHPKLAGRLIGIETLLNSIIDLLPERIAQVEAVVRSLRPEFLRLGIHLQSRSKGSV